MSERVRKKLVWDDQGVSEILADILILVMTVVLFAVIFAFVWSLPAPDEATYADFEGSVDMDSFGGRINLTHTSGEDLRDAYTQIILVRNYHDETRDLLTKSSLNPYGDNPGGYGLTGDGTWSTGEKWTYYFGGLEEDDDLELRVIDTRTFTLISGTKLMGAGANDAPIIMERWYDPSPGANATTMKIYARVRDPDGYRDIETSGSVYMNVSAMSSTQSIVNFNLLSHTNYIGTFETPDINVDQGQGTYLLTIKAKDSSGVTDVTGRIRVDVTTTVLNAPLIMERWAIPEVGVNGTPITVYARVEDSDGWNNIDYVKANITNLTGDISNVVNMVDYEQDGIWEYMIPVVNVSMGDLYNISFEVRDITNLYDTAHLNISVNRFNPVISRVWTVPLIGKDEEAITIYAEVFDPDGYQDIDFLGAVMINLTQLNPALGWENMLDNDRNGIFEYNMTDTGEIIDVPFGGEKALYLTAKDKEDNQVEANMTVWVMTRYPPVIESRWIDPVFPENNTNLSIYVQVMDPDGYADINLVEVNVTHLDRNFNVSGVWYEMIDINEDGIFINITLVDQEEGSYVLNFRASDMSNNTVNASLNFTILPYMPRFLNVWTSPTIGKNGSNIEIFANVMDPNGYADIDYVQVNISQINQSRNATNWWVVMNDLENGTFNWTEMINVNETGVYSLYFTVADLDNNIASASLQLLITSNKPTILQTFYYPSPAVNGTNVTIAAWIWDEDGREDILYVRANVTLLNSSAAAANESIWINLTDDDLDNIYENLTFVNVTAAGEYSITLEVMDLTNNIKTRDFTVNVTLIEVVSGEEFEPTVFGMAYPNAVGGGSQFWVSAYASNGSDAGEKVDIVQFSWGGTTYTMDRIIGNFYRYPNPFGAPLVTSTEVRDVDVWAKNSTGDIIATDTIKLLILWDETGGEVNRGTALEKNVAWIAYDQGFVITNNKTSNKTVQVFEMFDPKDAMCHVKIGSNSITNTEKVNIFRITSRTTGEVIGPPYLPDDLKFEYDGVMAGYWFFNLSFPTQPLFDYIADNTGPGPNQFPAGTNAEYFDVYMYIKDTTDDYFMTETWMVVTDTGTPGFYPYLRFWYDEDYIPGVDITDSDGDKIPDSPPGVQGPTSDYYTFQNTDVVYVEIITDTTGAASSADFTNLEIQDFWGNHMISNPEDQGAVGPISTHTDQDGYTRYIVAVDLLRADKDPWLMGKVAYTIIISGFKENDGDLEEFTYLAKQIIIESPSSIMDIVSGHEHGQGATFTGKYHGHFYENMNGYWDSYLYAFQGPAKGQTDSVGEIWTVAFDDLDGDSDREIVTGRAGNGDPTLSVWENLGGGNFEEVEIDHITDEIHSVAIGHVDKVGSLEPLDIVIGTSGGEVIYYRNDGYWDQTTVITTSAGYNVGSVSIGHAIEIADLDNDGDGDVVVGSAKGLTVFRNDGGVWFKAYDDDLKTGGGQPNTGVSVAIGLLEEDYDDPGTEDTYLDIVVGNDVGEVWRYLNSDSDLTSWGAGSVALGIDTGNVYTDIGNIDGLTYLDVVAGCDDTIRWYENTFGGTVWTPNSDGNIIGTLPAPGSQDITALRVGNVDGAIEDDIAVATTGNSQGQDFAGGLVYYYRNMGRASDWMRFEVDDLYRLGAVMDIYSIAIGDADLGSW